ncbi:dihydrofolate reductase [Microbacterium sp. 4R-513]|uniref:dihydrofolate reductase family protein n=1 Tax=Microbacterium sp. 4R-513 TaxID=2567934 RepID=UPI0013E10518|nr:dihydrofolate reductase family protein [Microbacterium sp. 4R-513]QIG38475.1 dihydrofolate reductase [Microbacterium sp. 4R-513]
MGAVIASATVSLDGFIAYPDNLPGELFDWYESGDVEVPHAGDFPNFRFTPESEAYWREFTESVGVLVVGRTLFDITDGWKGRHPLDVPVVVVTHEPPTDWSYPGSENFDFVTTGIADAIARAQQIAGDRVVAVAAGTIASQALAAGLLDEVAMDLVPVILGRGVPYFVDLPPETVMLGDPTVVVQGRRATHLKFPVLR